jgi:hypothetical protein
METLQTSGPKESGRLKETQNGALSSFLREDIGFLKGTFGLFCHTVLFYWMHLSLSYSSVLRLFFSPKNKGRSEAFPKIKELCVPDISLSQPLESKKSVSCHTNQGML